MTNAINHRTLWQRISSSVPTAHTYCQSRTLYFVLWFSKHIFKIVAVQQENWQISNQISVRGFWRLLLSWNVSLKSVNVTKSELNWSLQRFSRGNEYGHADTQDINHSCCLKVCIFMENCSRACKKKKSRHALLSCLGIVKALSRNKGTYNLFRQFVKLVTIAHWIQIT